ncbi:HAD-IC family P-type ATPase [Aggregatilineales bacterium SYSU G02658]
MAEVTLPPPMTTTTPAPSGLTHAEALERQRRGDDNSFQVRVGRTYGQIVVENVFNLFNIVLFSLLFIVLSMGDYATVFFAGFSVVSNTFLGMLQEIHAKRRLDKLAALSEQTVHVKRDGQWQEISMRAVVIDDILRIEPGDKLVVDGVVVTSDSLEMDESLLTGESDAVAKEPGMEVFSGSFCLAGSGTMQATRVGANSNINKLAAVAKQYKRVRTPTQQIIETIVQVTVVVMFTLIPMVFVASFVNSITPLEALRSAVVFVTSLVPQGLVLVAILSLTIGAIKISLQRTLIQRVNAVESLGNATVLCFDKTGTLTKNLLAVQQIIPLADMDERTLSGLLLAYLDNLAHLNRTAGAVREYAAAHADDVPARRKVREVPFTSGRKWGAVVFEDAAYVLGAPERVLPKQSLTDTLDHNVTHLSLQGLRVLAFTRVSGPLNEKDVTNDAEPLALVVLSDQIRDDIQETLESFRREGIDLKVISGDNLDTVKAIATQAGMDAERAYTGAQVDEMSDSELETLVGEATVFARVDPDTKKRIVAALQRRGAYVAMVGDGVNDVPALKQANLAIVMNDGTQISKDVADIVLLDNAMSTLPKAFREGTEITQTIFGTMKMFLVKNVYNILFFIFVAFMSLPFPITPVQISWSTFGTVNLPATFVAFGWLRPTRIRRFRSDVLEFIMTAGLIGAVMQAIVYACVFFYEGRDVQAARTSITLFVTFYGAYTVMHIMGLDVLNPRTFIARWRFALLMTLSTTLTILTMYALPELFEFRIMTWERDPGVIALLVSTLLLSIVLLEHGMRYPVLLRRFWRLFEEPSAPAASQPASQ